MSDASRSGPTPDDPVREAAAYWFARLRSNEAGESDRAGWRQWMECDARHRAAYRRLEQRWREIGAWTSQPAVADRLAAIPPARPAVSTGLRRHPRGHRWARWPIAATLAATALFAVWWTNQAQPQTVEYATAIGESRSVVLEDGTRVDLDTGTRLRVEYTKRARTVRFERGRAHFEVVRDGRPMRVETSFGEIRVLGTVFEVDRQADALDVALIEGRVEVAPTSAVGDARPVQRLQSGERLSIAGDGRLSRSAFEGEPASWRGGRLVFDDVSLAEAVAEFNRYGRARIRLADPALADIHVSGAFRSKDPAGFLEALQLVHGVSSSEDAAGDVVLSRP